MSKTITNVVGEETAGTGSGGQFQSMVTAGGVTAPQILKELALFPADTDGYEGDYFYFNNGAKERFPIRGGYWIDGAYAGVFYLHLGGPRSYSGTNIGFRSALRLCRTWRRTSQGIAPGA